MRSTRQHGISHVVIVGLLANTCIESTGRFAMELGYHVTLVRDATAAFTRELMRAAHELNGPTFAHAIVQPSSGDRPNPKLEGNVRDHASIQQLLVLANLENLNAERSSSASESKSARDG